MSEFGAVELGGTKILVAVGSAPQNLRVWPPIPTGEPQSTLRSVVGLLETAEIAAVGIASFGPLESRRSHPDYGSIVSTPKSGWSGVNPTTEIGNSLHIPVSFDTDVNAAALAEGRWGASRDMENHAYVTVGTGIGIGAVLGGHLVHGLTHPEMGHLVVRPDPDDPFPGVCPYHGNCLEGMASGPAIEARFGISPVSLGDSERDRAVALLGRYLAQALRDLVYVLSPQRVVIGGGVSKLPGFHEAVRTSLVEELGGYRAMDDQLAPAFVSPPALADRSGLLGALMLAMDSGH